MGASKAHHPTNQRPRRRQRAPAGVAGGLAREWGGLGGPWACLQQPSQAPPGGSHGIQPTAPAPHLGSSSSWSSSSSTEQASSADSTQAALQPALHQVWGQAPRLPRLPPPPPPPPPPLPPSLPGACGSAAAPAGTVSAAAALASAAALVASAGAAAAAGIPVSAAARPHPRPAAGAAAAPRRKVATTAWRHLAAQPPPPGTAAGWKTCTAWTQLARGGRLGWQRQHRWSSWSWTLWKCVSPAALRTAPTQRWGAGWLARWLGGWVGGWVAGVRQHLMWVSRSAGDALSLCCARSPARHPSTPVPCPSTPPHSTPCHATASPSPPPHSSMQTAADHPEAPDFYDHFQVGGCASFPAPPPPAHPTPPLPERQIVVRSRDLV